MTFYEDFSEAEWTALLHNEQIFKYDNILIMRRLMDAGGEATCSQLANDYGKSWGYYNSMCSKLAKRIADFKQMKLDKRPDGQEIRWPVLFSGRNVSSKDDVDGSFIWILKPNLKKALEKMNLSKYEPLYELSELDKLYEEFNQRFPIENLESISLEQYTNLDGDYFCTWVERKTQKLGSIQGATSFKFGIYKYKKLPKDRSGRMYDEEYAWLSKFGEKRDEVYLTVREELVQVAQAARKGNFEIVDKSKLSPMFKWKVAFLYSEKKLIPIYDKKMLVYIASQKGMSDAKSAEVSHIQKYLLNVPDRNPDLWEYYKELLEIWKAKEPQYFVAKITDAPNILKNAIQNNYWAMQQRYGVQKSAAVTNNFKPVLQMQTGDILFLGNENRLLAYGKVKQVEYDTENVLSLKDTIDNKGYEDIQEDGYVIFEDCDVYYEKRYEGYEEDWSQFINVEEWKSLCENSQVTTAGVGKAADLSVNSIFQVKDSKWAGDKMKELDEQFNKMKPENKNMLDDVKTLLLNNHNIILHGAPGTGKTYLAKEVAKAMGCTENEIGFVQFHQSYDYTDFVEGLRPNSDLHFGLRPGVFKSFCAQALKNLLESSKKEEDLNKENKTFDYCYQYLVQNNGFEGNNKVGDKEIVVENNEIYFKQRSRNRHLKKSNVKLLFEYLLDNEKNVLEDEDQMSDKKLNSLIEDLTDGDTKKLDCYLIRPLLVDLYKVYMDESEVKIKSIDKKNYCFIIDEINRGEMSKIFGELFYSLEPGYRVKIGDLVDSEKREKLVTIRTQYANMNKIANDFDEALKIYDDDDFGHFFVPENVYIIGTMNDIDRSVESMDFAMRRRFAFKEIKADERIEMLDSLKCGKKSEAVKCMQALNKEIESISGLSSAYHIGPAYFLKLDNYEGKFEDLWKYHIEGVLREYLRGMPKAADHLNKLKECYDKSIASESSVSSDNASDSVENS